MSLQDVYQAAQNTKSIEANITALSNSINAPLHRQEKVSPIQRKLLQEAVSMINPTCWKETTPFLNRPIAEADVDCYSDKLYTYIYYKHSFYQRVSIPNGQCFVVSSMDYDSDNLRCFTWKRKVTKQKPTIFHSEKKINAELIASYITDMTSIFQTIRSNLCGSQRFVILPGYYVSEAAILFEDSTLYSLCSSYFDILDNDGSAAESLLGKAIYKLNHRDFSPVDRFR